MYILAPSLLAADFTKLGEQIKETERCGAQFLPVSYTHLDVYKRQGAYGCRCLQADTGRHGSI